MVLGASMAVMLAACGGGNGGGLEGNSYDMEIDGYPAGTFEFRSEGEFTVEDGTGTEAEGYEVTDDDITLIMSNPVEDVTINLVLSYDDLSADVIEGEVLGFTLDGEDLPEEAVEGQVELSEEFAGTAYTLTKIEDEEE